MSTYSDLKIELIATGDQLNTWGDTTNDNFAYAVEQAIIGRGTLQLANPPANPTDIQLVNSNAAQTGRNYILNVTSAGTLAATANILVSDIDKPYIIENNTTGGQDILIKTTNGTGVTIPNGRKALIYSYNNGFGDDEVVYGPDYFYQPLVEQSTLDRPVTNGGKLAVSALGTLTTGTTTIDLAAAQVYTATVTASNTITFAFSNAPAASQGQAVVLRITDGGSGTIVWPAGTLFSYGVPPALTPSGVDLLSIFYDPVAAKCVVLQSGTDLQEEA